MGENSGDGSKWEENLYWTHFQSTMFFQPLARGFDRQLAIPEKFARNMKKKLPDNVTLIGPSRAKWNIRLVSSGETLLLKNGWKKFAEDNFLKEDDVLIFKYNGESMFDVLIFNGQSFCERESSYFVRKCGHAEVVGEFPTKRNTESPDVDDLSDYGGESKSNSSKEPRTNENLRPRRLGRPRRKQSMKRVGVQKKVNSVAKDGSGGSYHLQYVSNRRPVTEDEKKTAQQRARAAWTHGSIMVVMQPSHVYRRFFLTLPADWVRSQLPRKSDDVTLRVIERKGSWHARYNGSGVNARGLSGGWKDFAFDNNLEEFDACMFRLASDIHDGIVLNVSIFRVVEEVTPLTRVSLTP